MIQCIGNLIICLIFLSIKFTAPGLLTGLEKYGIEITDFKKVKSNWQLGVILGIMNLANILFGLIALKYNNIPT